MDDTSYFTPAPSFLKLDRQLDALRKILLVENKQKKNMDAARRERHET